MHVGGGASQWETAPPLANGVVAGADVAVDIGAALGVPRQPARQARDRIGQGAPATWWGELPLSFCGRVSSPLTTPSVAQSPPYNKETGQRLQHLVTVTV